MTAVPGAHSISEDLTRWVVDSTGRLIVWAGALFVAVHIAGLIAFAKPDGRIVSGDALDHYMQLRSIVFDRDLDFRNDFMRLYGLSKNSPNDVAWLESKVTPNGHVRTYMPVGPALLWAPLYLIVAGVQALLASVHIAPNPDGYGRVLLMVPGVVGVMSATFAAWLSWRSASHFTNPLSAAAGVWGIWLGTHALYYSIVAASYSHAASMLTSALLVAHWLRPAPWSVRRAAASGALAGLAALMRWQDALLLAIALFESWRSMDSVRARLTAMVAAVLAAAAVFSPQMIVWHVLYDHWLVVPQGPSFMTWASPHLVAVLFSERHGLFSWAPLLVLSVIGLTTFVRRYPRWGMPAVAVMLATWYVNASVADWWAGEAFGARRFLSLFPLFVIGLAVWVQSARVPLRRVIAIGVLVCANWLLLFQYELFMKGFRTIAPYPRAWFDLWLARFVVPFRLLFRRLV